MTEANHTETRQPEQYAGEATTAGTVETILAKLKNGATSSTAEERCDDE